MKTEKNINNKLHGWLLAVVIALWSLIAAAVVCIAMLPADIYSGFTLFWGRKVYFWTDGLVILIGLCLLGLLVIRIVHRKKRTKSFVIGTAFLMLIVALLTGYYVVQFVSDLRTSVPKLAFKSPDGQHILYYDGGDSDIFGFSSGYGHYVQKSGQYQYQRVFYCLEDWYEPQIEWADDGFYVMKRCPDGNLDNSVDVVPESIAPFPYEELEDRYFFSYEPKEKTYE